MQSPEDFVNQFFAARTAQTRRELDCRAQFRASFFTKECVWDSRDRAIVRSEGERIVEVSGPDSKGAVTVTTREIHPFSPLRYVIVPVEESWRIQHVDMFIEGHGWKGDRDLMKGIEDLKVKMARRAPPSNDRPIAN